jgi:hypothetical protein
MRQRTVVEPAVILKPGGMGGVLVEVARAGAVVLVICHAP